MIIVKKKEVLVIFLLAVLVTRLSWFRRISLANCTLWGFPKPYFSACLHGTIFPPTDGTETEIIWQGLFMDFIFWFLALTGGWWIIKKLKTKK